ncbi:hypothetical protein EPI10_029119 [Gossypium australe]|uniref:Uncharacterized protein n=1 Tax=Gossypium australe TaxID=47621 RepID=A0A5B6V0J6_9ROSI|nr:hypothetical protein EPI10_029119 [Gossypium australe]
MSTFSDEVNDALNQSKLLKIRRDAIAAIKKGFEELKAQRNLIQMALIQVGSCSTYRGKRVKVPEPRCYEGWNTKKLDNFLFDMEQ